MRYPPKRKDPPIPITKRPGNGPNQFVAGSIIIPMKKMKKPAIPDITARTDLAVEMGSYLVSAFPLGPTIGESS